MVARVKFFVNGGVLHAEIGAQIDDLATELEEGNGVFRGDTVGQGEEDRLGLLGEQLGVWLREAERPGARKMRELSEGLRDGLASVLARGDGGEFGVRVVEEQAHQFFAGVAGGTHDSDSFVHGICPLSVVSGPLLCGKIEHLATDN